MTPLAQVRVLALWDRAAAWVAARKQRESSLAPAVREANPAPAVHVPPLSTFAVRRRRLRQLVKSCVIQVVPLASR